CQATQFGIELINKGGDEFGCHHAFPQPGKHPFLDLLPANGEVVRAGALRAARGAAVAVEANDCIAATAAAADEQAAQQEPASVGSIERIALFVAADAEPDLLLACLYPVPRSFIDDPEVRNLDDLPSIRRIGPGHPLAGARVLDIAASVPFEPPDIEGVVQDPGAAVGLTSNRRVAPRTFARTGNLVRIELFGDGPRAAAGGEFGEDASHDRRFTAVDATLAGGLGDDVVAIGLAAREF